MKDDIRAVKPDKDFIQKKLSRDRDPKLKIIAALLGVDQQRALDQIVDEKFLSMKVR